MLRTWRADALALGVLALAVLAFFWDVLLGPRVLLPADVLYSVAPWSGLPGAAAHAIPHNALIADAILQNVAWKSFAREALLGGELPLWNPYEFAGMPFLAGGQSGSIYPLGVLFYLIPVERAYGPFLALHLYLGGAFAYAFGRVLGSRPSAALIGGLTFAFSAFLIVSFTWPMIVSGAIWLPLLLLFVELLVAGHEAGRPNARQIALALVGGLAFALQILAGHLEISFYAAFALLFYGVARLLLGPIRLRDWSAAARAFRDLAIMGLLGPLLAAVQLVPFFELIGQNFRSGFVDLPTVLSYALPLSQLATFLVPDFYGNPSHHAYFSLAERAWRSVGNAASGQPTDPPGTIWWGSPKNYVEAASYLGILPLVLALWGAARVRTRQVAGLVALGAWSLLLAFGSPLYGLLFFGIPGIDQLHTPFRWIYPYSIVVSALAALGAQAMVCHRSRIAERLGLILAGLGGIGVLAAVAVLARPGRVTAVADALVHRSSRVGRAFADGDMLLSYEWRNLLLLALLVAAAGVVVWLLARRPYLGLAAGSLLVALDLFAAHAGFNTRADPAPIRQEPPALAFLRSTGEPFRVVGMIRSDALSPITGMLTGVEDVRGYDTVIPRRFVEYWSQIEPARGLEYSKLQGIDRVESLASPLLRLLNIYYVVSSQPVSSPALDLVHQGDAFVYRLRGALPRLTVVPTARVVSSDAEALGALADPRFDPAAETVLVSGTPIAGRGGTARFLERTPNRLRIEAEIDGGGYLRIADFYFTGWRATVDGAPAEVLRADHAFRAVALGPGRHVVELTYRPTSVLVGGLVSVLGGLVFLLGLGGCAGIRVVALRSDQSAAARITRNVLSGMGTSLLNKAIDFAFAIVTLRALQADGVGRYALAIAISGYLEIWSTFGLNALVIREGSQHPDRMDRVGGSSLLLRLVLWLAGLPVVVAVLLVYRASGNLADETLVATLLLCIALLPGNVAATYSSLFYAAERVEVPAALTVMTTIVKVFLGLAALLLGYGIVGLAVVALFGNVGTALALGLLARTLGVAPRLSASAAEARAMVAPALPLMLNHLLATLFFRIDVLLLQPMRGDRELGYYATAYKFVDGMGIIPAAFTFAIFPVLSRLGAQRADGMRAAYALSLKLLVFVSVPIALLLTAAAYPLVRAIGGESFLPDAAIALQLLIWFLPLSFANGLTQYALVAVGQQRAITVAFVIAVAFNLVANLVAIPIYGYRAAAVVTALSELALAIPFGIVVQRSVGLSLVRVVGPFVVAAAAALVVYLAVEPLLGGAVALLLGGVAYLGGLVVLRALEPEERAQVNRVLYGMTARFGVKMPAP